MILSIANMCALNIRKTHSATSFMRTVGASRVVCADYLRTVVAGWAGVDLNEPGLVLIVHHEIVAVQLPRVTPVLDHVLLNREPHTKQVGSNASSSNM